MKQIQVFNKAKKQRIYFFHKSLKPWVLPKTEMYSEPCQTSMMLLFVIIVRRRLTIVWKKCRSVLEPASRMNLCGFRHCLSRNVFFVIHFPITGYKCVQHFRCPNTLNLSEGLELKEFYWIHKQSSILSTFIEKLNLMLRWVDGWVKILASILNIFSRFKVFFSMDGLNPSYFMLFFKVDFTLKCVVKICVCIEEGKPL